MTLFVSKQVFMMDNFCVFMVNALEQERQYSASFEGGAIPQQIKDEVIVIPHSYSAEENVFRDDLDKLCQANDMVRRAIDIGKPIQVEYSLADIVDIVPRKRVRSDSYIRFQRYLRTKGIDLLIHSRKSQKAKA